jgi:four helix bundle protein
MGVVKKEAKETQYWLKLIRATNQSETHNIHALIEENEQLVKIFASIIIKSST